jgi:hypothetical protein
MGELRYGSGTYAIDDATLAHLQRVTIAKLRRREYFLLTLAGPRQGDGARVSLAMHAASHLEFRFEADAAMPLDRDRLQTLASAANTAQGLVLELTSLQSATTATAPTRPQTTGR